ncbi:MAG: hypothetical protein WAV72_24865 [Bradyrhizobium sp.]
MQTYSVNRCAEMLERDRATLIRALKNTPRDAGTAARPQYKIATAAKAVAAHLDGGNGGGGNVGGTDPTLQALFAEFDRQDAEMRKLPELEQRRAAARILAPLIAEIDRSMRARDRANGVDPEYADLRADKVFLLTARGLEGPCEWSLDQAFEAMAETVS